GICVWFLLKGIRNMLLYWWERKHYQYVLIIPHESDEIDLEKLGQLIRQIHRSGRKPLERLIRGRDWYRFMMYRPKDKEGEKEKVRLYIGGPKSCVQRVEQAFRTHYKHAEIYRQQIDEIPFPSSKAVGGRLVMLRKRLEATLSLATYKKDILPTFMHSIEEQTWVDIAFSPDNGYKLIKGIRKAEKQIVKRKKEHGGNFFICRQGTDNAAILEKVTQQHFSASYLQGLPERTAAIQTQDKIDGETKHVWCTITAPPMDKYVPSGEIATYGDKRKQKESDTWTYSKIKELESRGKHINEIDQEINAFLYDVSLPTVTKEGKQAVKLQKVAQSNGSLLQGEELEEHTDQTAPGTVETSVCAGEKELAVIEEQEKHRQARTVVKDRL
ncbi:hypothetical protein ACQKFJ_29190, partial [Bacillus mycoides]